jgi:hypothetical protein
MKPSANPSVLGVVVFAASLLVSQFAGAHHSNAMYDHDTVTTLEGVVTKYEWANPHVYIYIEGAPQSGERAEWRIEANATGLMRLRGWSENSLEPGERVAVEANLHRNPDRHAALGQSVTKENGQILRVRESRDGAEEVVAFTASSLSGNWLPSGSEVARFLRQGSASWPLTEAGRTAFESFTDVDNPDEAINPGKDCAALPPPITMMFPVVTTIDVGENTVSIHMSIVGDVERTVHMNVDSHDGVEYTYQGHSIGRWDGDALVVDTAYFAPHVYGIAENVASGPDKHVSERFELAPDRTSLTYSYVLEDPEYLREPITGSMRWAYRPDLPYLAQPCDIENARRYLE